MNKNELFSGAIDIIIHTMNEVGITVPKDSLWDGNKPAIKSYFNVFSSNDEKTATAFFHLGFNNNADYIPVWLKAVKKNKDEFLNYRYCRIADRLLIFEITETEIEIFKAKSQTMESGNIEKVINKVQKLLALSSNNPSEGEAIAASLQAQKLLAKYNLSITDVTGEEKKEDICECFADTGTGKKWKYRLASIVAASYRCKVYYRNNSIMIFYGYESDTLVARRIFTYLFKVGDRLAKKYVREYKEANYWGNTTGLYNSFVEGFTDGVKRELDKGCVALMLVTPTEVNEAFCEKSKEFKKINTQLNTNNNYDGKLAFENGFVEGKRAMNGTYIASE